MKTAVSIPDHVFRAAETLADRLGISRSELFARALAAYTKAHQHDRVREALDLVYDEEPPRLDAALWQMQWASLSNPLGSAPGFRRPVLVIQCDPFNESRINTVVVAAVTSNLRLAKASGNVLLDSGESNLPRDSVVNVSQILTIDKSFLVQRVSLLADQVMTRVDAGVRLVMTL